MRHRGHSASCTNTKGRQRTIGKPKEFLARGDEVLCTSHQSQRRTRLVQLFSTDRTPSSLCGRRRSPSPSCARTVAQLSTSGRHTRGVIITIGRRSCQTSSVTCAAFSQQSPCHAVRGPTLCLALSVCSWIWRKTSSIDFSTRIRSYAAARQPFLSAPNEPAAAHVAVDDDAQLVVQEVQDTRARQVLEQVDLCARAQPHPSPAGHMPAPSAGA